MNLEFEYTNWRGEEHTYVVEPDYRAERRLTHDQHAHDDRPYWYLNAMVVTRDGNPRPEMGDNRRRSFRLGDIRALREVRRSR